MEDSRRAKLCRHLPPGRNADFGIDGPIPIYQTALPVRRGRAATAMVLSEA